MKNTVTGPDTLLENIGRSIMFKAMLISVIGHIVFTGLTSISLFKDWVSDWDRFGLKAPGTINAIKGQDRKAAEEAQRKAEAEKKAEAARAEAEAAAAKNDKSAKPADAKPADAKAPAAAAKDAKPTDAKAPAADAKADAKTPPEVQPLPPKTDFTLGDDLSLD